jgi:formylglycine-generating enzyme required for sulfatase activity
LGSEQGEFDEKPLTKVTVAPFQLQRVEVSVAQYADCVRAGRCSTDTLNTYSLCNWRAPGREGDPLNCLGWDQAKAYCTWRSARLPTEAEWEFAARGADGRLFPWGNDAPAAGRATFGRKGEGTTPVGSNAAGASPFGVLNLAGNVWEWTEDSYAPYPGGSITNPHPEAGSDRVFRGGGWVNEPSMLRATARDKGDPSNRDVALGVRCAR